MAHLAVLTALIVLDVVALVLCWRSTHRGEATKVLWTLLVVFVPVLGAVGLLVVEGVAAAARRVVQH
ncbi:PLDc N-terminal domain-containing protein [Curtobacterium sp. MCLR17_036]|uniref:PLDc N-terminal domain-containing protein n=1 Tax=Curtobacterium sp. MCLR17_036 TaxID=2175620 RepID=UPI000DAACEBC|nr:PLDc N-terminal domain-containing protein [Curtobacterium sp. MCLR17_036]WIE64152.1 PLDc N-terminal domain-containing protein [Curtobacterium sp. MCLR17_036]